MKPKEKKVALVWVLAGGLLLAGCAERSAAPARPETKDEAGAKEPGAGIQADGDDSHESIVVADLDDGESSGLVDLARAKKFLKDNKLNNLLDTFEPAQVPRLKSAERAVLADIFYGAAKRLKTRYKDIPYSSMFCERGLMLNEKHQPLLRLQIRNYLHPDMKLFGGAEELAVKLVEQDPQNQENQFLRGKVAFDQGEWDVAVSWLKRAARVGRTQKSKLIKQAWHLLDLAKGHQQEIKSALSMTRELEVMMKRARMRNRDLAKLNPEASKKLDPASLPGGSVTLYMTHWCGYCRKTRKLLKDLKVPFEEKNIEKDEGALMEMMRMAESSGVEITGVPVLRIGSKLVVGYNPQRIQELIQKMR